MNEVNIPSRVRRKLLDFQIPHLIKLIKSIRNNDRALDASDTGTGKTYIGVALCIILGLRPLIICPKSVLTPWRKVLRFFRCGFYGIVNYESIHNCRYYKPGENKKSDCPYIRRTRNDQINEYVYKWRKLPNDIIIIFDEVHRCKNKITQNHIMLRSLAITTARILMLSATACDNADNFALVGFVLGLYDKIKDSKKWIRSLQGKHDNVMQAIHEVVFPCYGSRIRISDLGDVFPKNTILAQCYDMATAKEIEEQYKLIEEEVEHLKFKEENSGCVLSRILYARMRIEQLKIPTFLEQARMLKEDGKAIAIFVNFTSTLETIADELGTRCVIYGEQTLEERDENIEKFVDNRRRYIICNIRSGGTGISIQDINGVYPVNTIISPSWSAQDVLQALGRAHRAKGKSEVVQHLVFCKGTIEEQICRNLCEKIKNIACLNDGDINSYKIEGLLDVDGNSQPKTPKSEFELTFEEITALMARQKRLENDLEETKNKIKQLEIKLDNM